MKSLHRAGLIGRVHKKPQKRVLVKKAEVHGHVPGTSVTYLARMCYAVVRRMSLSLKGRVVFTEAATGAYCVTPVLAALAGARCVYAIANDSAHGSAQVAVRQTRALSNACGVGRHIHFVFDRQKKWLQASDIITNSGHVRPIDAQMISWMKPGAVVPLMYEAWELRASDVDVPACNRRGIQVGATNERHPHVGVFSYLGLMAVKQFLDAGIPLLGKNVLLLCDNDFSPFIRKTLASCGARVKVSSDLRGLTCAAETDVVLVALNPARTRPLGSAEARQFARCCPQAVMLQFFGDITRRAFLREGFDIWPPSEPRAGHMGILPSVIGSDPIIRLQCAGLKVAEVLLKEPAKRTSADLAYVQLMPVDKMLEEPIQP